MIALPIKKIALIFSLFSISASAHAVIDADAKVVSVRSGSCLEGGVELNNCFKSLTDLETWIKNDRAADAGALVAEIGPGFYPEGFGCSGMKNISLKGAGKDKTILGESEDVFIDVNGVPFLAVPAKITARSFRATNCFNLSVQDLTIKGNWAVNWDGPGSSTWTNVDIEAHGLYGWRESCATVTNDVERPKHFWYSSRILGVKNTKVAYFAACSENWFFGSEITNQSAGESGGIRAVQVRANSGSLYENHVPEVHIYGSVVRILVPAGADYQGSVPGGAGDGAGIYALGAGLRGSIHVHGTGIDVIGNSIGNNVAALVTGTGGAIHAAQSAFVLKTGAGGNTYRIRNDGGTIRAPYLWEPEVLSSPLLTADGADTTVEMICSAGTCQPHMMIYSSNCTANGPWFDIVTAQCR